jgi:cell division septum initiation protein DivIVA
MNQKTNAVRNMSVQKMYADAKIRIAKTSSNIYKGAKAQAAEVGDAIQEQVQKHIGEKLQMAVRRKMYGGTLAEVDQQQIYQELFDANKLMDDAEAHLASITENDESNPITQTWDEYIQTWYDVNNAVIQKAKYNKIRELVNMPESEIVEGEMVYSEPEGEDDNVSHATPSWKQYYKIRRIGATSWIYSRR